ncbi:MAG: hypothetical protein PVSMB7_06790 [Chloroflexota bacterium]
MARWTRAFKLLPLGLNARVLDLGCAFGFGTRLLARSYKTFGHDLSEAHIARARRLLPSVPFTCGPADRIPYADAYFDGVVLLDVLEHVPDDVAVINEVARVLAAGGTLVVSVPNRGLFEGLDSLNVYRALLGRDARPPTDDPSWSRSPIHRHYALSDIHGLLEPDFAVRDAHYTGLGLAEILNLALLLCFKAWAAGDRAYGGLQYLYFAAYLLEDLLPAGSWGYHLMVVAERQ